jgi:hypothetical protein
MRWVTRRTSTSLKSTPREACCLRLRRYSRGQPFQRIEAREIAFDESLPDDLFVFAPPAGEEVKPFESFAQFPRGVSLTEAARGVPFTVFALDEVPEGWAAEAQWVPGRDRPAAPALVILRYVTRDGLNQLNISQAADAGDRPDGRYGRDWSGWREVQIGELTARVHDGDARWRQAQVEYVREGTHIGMNSMTFDADKLVELAGRLVPAPTETPAL